MRRQLDLKLALWLVGIVFVFGVSLHALHAYQVDRNADALLHQADRALDKKQIDQALRMFGHYLAYRPHDTDARARYGLLLEKHATNPPDRLRAALTLQEVLRDDPSRKDVRFRLVHCLVNLQRLPEAIGEAEKLLTDWDKPGEIEHVLGWCHEAQGKYEKAAEWFRKAIAIDPHRLESYVLLAEVLQAKLNEPEQAAEVMNDLVQHNPRSFQAYLTRSRFLQKHGDNARAEKDIQEALTLAPEEQAVLLAAADWSQSHGNSDTARKHLAKGIALHPTDATMYKALAGLELTSGKRAPAKELLRQGLKQNPESVDLSVLLIDILIDEAELAEAEQLLADLRRSGFVSPMTDYFQGRLKVQRGQWSSAIPLLERARAELGAGSEWASRVNLLLGLCYRQSGDLEQQLTAFRLAVLLEPTWTAAHMGLGSALLTAGRQEEAMLELQLVSKSADAPPEVWTELARCMLLRTQRQLAQQQNWAELNKLLDKCEKVRPGSIEVRILRAEVLAAQKKFDEAADLLENARGKFPKNIAIESALADLARRENRFDEATKIIDQAEKTLGNSLEIRLARIRLWRSANTPQARQVLAAQADNLQSLSIENRTRILREVADALANQGDTTVAEKLWRRLIQDNPSDVRSRFRIVEAKLQAGQVEQVRPLLLELRKLEGEKGTLWRHAMAASLLAESPHQPAKLAEARRIVAEARRLQRDWGRLPLLEARIDEADGKPALAIQNYQAAFELGERSPRMVFRLIQLLQDRHNFASAEDVLRKFEDEAPLPSELSRLGAEIALSNNNLKRALALAKAAVPAASRDYRDYLWLAKIHEAADQQPQAEQYLRQAVALAGHTPDTWVALVRHLVRAGERGAAESVVRQARDKVPPARAAFTLARCYEALGEPEEAEKYFHEALTQRPDDFTILFAAGDFFRSSDQPVKAIPVLKKALRPEVAAPIEMVVRGRRQLAVILGPSDPKQALELLDMNRSLLGANVTDVRARALVEGTTPRKQLSSIQAFEATLGGGSGSPEEMFLYAKLCEAADNAATARRVLLELVTSNPHNAQYLAHYARSQALSGELSDALSYFHKLERLEPKSQRTLELKKLILKI